MTIDDVFTFLGEKGKDYKVIETKHQAHLHTGLGITQEEKYIRVCTIDKFDDLLEHLNVNAYKINGITRSAPGMNTEVFLVYEGHVFASNTFYQG